MNDSDRRTRKTLMQRTYEGSTSASAGARADLDTWLAACDVVDAVRADAALIVSELTSNAYEAAPGADMELTSSLAGPVLTIAVTNRGGAGRVPDRADWGPEDLLSSRGRGLAIVDALSDSVVVDESTPGWTTVTATLRVD